MARSSNRDVVEIRKQIRKLKNCALDLDEGISAGQIEWDKITTAQSYLDSVADDLLNDSRLNNDAYLIYELQALIHWVNGEKEEALDLIDDAVKMKGDANLLTDNGSKLSSDRMREWDIMDTVAVVLVGLFWTIGVLVVVTNTVMPKRKRWQIILYGTLTSVGFFALSVLTFMVFDQST